MDRYPVKATIDGRTVRNLRLAAGAAGAVVWQMDRASGEVVELVRTDVPPQRVGASQSWEVAGITFEPQRGCGCNHPMYRWVPPVDAGVGG